MNKLVVVATCYIISHLTAINLYILTMLIVILLSIILVAVESYNDFFLLLFLDQYQ